MAQIHTIKKNVTIKDLDINKSYDDNDEDFLSTLFSADFTSVFSDQDSSSIKQTHSYTRPARQWGLPTFQDQVDRGISQYELIVGPHRVLLDLEFRKNSTGSDIWDSTLVLAHYLRNIQLSGKHVLELGSGVGGVGLLCKLMGAASVTLTDLEPNCDLLRRNAIKNALGEQVNVFCLEWGVIPLAPHVKDLKLDFILGSDLFLPFAPELLKPLCQTISVLLHECCTESAIAILVYEERFDCSPFFDFCKEFELTVEFVHNDELVAPYKDPGRIHVIKLHKYR